MSKTFDIPIVYEPYVINTIFPNNMFLHIYKNMLEKTKPIMPRTPHYSLVTTYDKAVEYINKMNENVDEYSTDWTYTVIQPGEIRFDERLNMPWHMVREGVYPQVFSRPPDLKLGNIKFWYIPMRLFLNFEFIYFCYSELQALDARIRLMSYFNTRFYKFENFVENCLFIGSDTLQKIQADYFLPTLDELVDSGFLQVKTVDAYNRTLYGLPAKLNLYAKMNDVSTGSSYMGGAELPQFRINTTFECWVSIPYYIAVMYDADFIVLKIGEEVGQDIVPGKDIMTYKYFDDQWNLIYLYDFNNPTTVEWVKQDWTPDVNQVRVWRISLDNGLYSEITNDCDITDDGKKFIITVHEDSSKYTVLITYQIGEGNE